MTDALRPNRQRAQYGFRPGRLSCVTNQMQPAIACVREHVAEPVRGSSLFIAADPIRNGSFVSPGHGKLCHFQSLFPDRIDGSRPDPKRPDGRALRFAPYRVVNSRQILLLP